MQGAAKKTITGAVSFLRELTHTASNLYHKRTNEEEEDAEYLKVSACVVGGAQSCCGPAANLQFTVVCAPIWTGEGIRARAGATHERGASPGFSPCTPPGRAWGVCPGVWCGNDSAGQIRGVGAFGGECAMCARPANHRRAMCRCPPARRGGCHRQADVSRSVQGLVADSFGRLGDRADAMGRLCAESSSCLASCFEAPLKEFVRGVKAVKKVCADRSAALAAYQQVRTRDLPYTCTLSRSTICALHVADMVRA